MQDKETKEEYCKSISVVIPTREECRPDPSLFQKKPRRTDVTLETSSEELQVASQKDGRVVQQTVRDNQETN